MNFLFFYSKTGKSNSSNPFYGRLFIDGIMISKVSFAGGNNAQNFELLTARDNVRKVISIPQSDKIDFHSSIIDPNAITLKRITMWLMENNYL